ncbi:MAG: metalloregulator ArsR/SmtB family transcription factor [Pseudomonadota bacterium]
MLADVDVFKACSDITRLRLLFLLRERELCVCELVAVLGMPQGKISRHLATLRQAGLVDTRREGAWIYYRLVAANGTAAKHVLAYLSESHGAAQVEQDRCRLKTLAAQGEICVPNPAPVLPAEIT